MRNFLRKTKIRVFKRINNYILEAQKDHVLLNLNKYGKNFQFQMPIYISGADYVEIGDNVSIAAFVHIWGEGGVKIGNNVMVGSHTAITSLTHNYNEPEMFNTLVSKGVVIHDDAWIGSHCIILPGVSIGEGCVVGAGSVVTKDVEPYSIVFGSPAKYYKSRNC